MLRIEAEGPRGPTRPATACGTARAASAAARTGCRIANVAAPGEPPRVLRTKEIGDRGAARRRLRVASGGGGGGAGRAERRDRYAIGIDVGGTFTDVVVCDDDRPTIARQGRHHAS